MYTAKFNSIKKNQRVLNFAGYLIPGGGGGGGGGDSHMKGTGVLVVNFELNP